MGWRGGVGDIDKRFGEVKESVVYGNALSGCMCVCVFVLGEGRVSRV